MPKRNEAKFEHGQQVYLLSDCSLWHVTHLIVGVSGLITYRISSVYESREVYDFEISDDPNLPFEIKGLKTKC